MCRNVLICCLFNGASSTVFAVWSRIVELFVSDELKSIRKWSWPNLRRYHEALLEGLTEPSSAMADLRDEILTQDPPYTSQEFRPIDRCP